MTWTTPKRIILDTDPGIDDALAILLGLASPEMKFEALTVVSGNCPLDQGIVNALAVLDLAGASHIPVVAGASLPLIRPLYGAEDVHGFSGLGYAQLPETRRTTLSIHAVDYLIERILAEPGELTVVAVGPLTNLALAIRREPAIVRAISELVIMGGSIRAGGNTTASAEFNIYVDPHAAHIVFHAGIPTTLVPLDVTRQCRLTSIDLERLLRIPSPISKFVADATRYYIETSISYGADASCALHDPLALAVAFAPQYVQLEALYVTVDIYSELSLGATIADFRRRGRPDSNRPNPNMKVAMAVDGPGFSRFFYERIEQLAQTIGG